jgi:hypothetical protein
VKQDSTLQFCTSLSLFLINDLNLKLFRINIKLDNLLIKQLTKQIGVAVKLLACIREVLGLNLSRDTSYPDRGFLWFFSVLPGKYRDITSISPQPLPSVS